ncbi:MAG: DUF4003 family protein [Christensenellales bacterium]
MGSSVRRKAKFYTLPSLGVLSMFPVHADRLSSEVVATYELLRTKKGSGRFSVTKQELLLLSSALVSFYYAGEAQNSLLTATLSTSITNIIVAQQTAIALSPPHHLRPQRPQAHDAPK